LRPPKQGREGKQQQADKGAGSQQATITRKQAVLCWQWQQQQQWEMPFPYLDKVACALLFYNW